MEEQTAGSPGDRVSKFKLLEGGESLSASWNLQLEISDGVTSERPIKHSKRKNQS